MLLFARRGVSGFDGEKIALPARRQCLNWLNQIKRALVANDNGSNVTPAIVKIAA